MAYIMEKKPATIWLSHLLDKTYYNYLLTGQELLQWPIYWTRTVTMSHLLDKTCYNGLLTGHKRKTCKKLRSLQSLWAMSWLVRNSSILEISPLCMISNGDTSLSRTMSATSLSEAISQFYHNTTNITTVITIVNLNKWINLQKFKKMLLSAKTASKAQKIIIIVNIHNPWILNIISYEARMNEKLKFKTSHNNTNYTNLIT